MLYALFVPPLCAPCHLLPRHPFQSPFLCLRPISPFVTSLPPFPAPPANWPAFLGDYILDSAALMVSAKVKCLDELLPKLFAAGSKVCEPQTVWMCTAVPLSLSPVRLVWLLILLPAPACFLMPLPSPPSPPRCCCSASGP